MQNKEHYKNIKFRREVHEESNQKSGFLCSCVYDCFQRVYNPAERGFSHGVCVKAAEMFSSETGASTRETYTTDDFTYTLIDEYSKVKILSYIGSDTDVVIPDRIDNKKVTSIADSAFREKSIPSVVFGQYVESIGNYAFYSCQSLNKLDFSKSSVKTIGNFAFILCKSLESI